MILGTRKSHCSLFEIDERAMFFQPVHTKYNRIVAECDELKGVYFKMFWAGLHDKACGVLRGVNGSVSECNMKFLLNKGEIVDLGEIPVNEGDGGPRVDHGIDRKGGALEVKGDRDRDGGRVKSILVNRRRMVKVA